MFINVQTTRKPRHPIKPWNVSFPTYPSFNVNLGWILSTDRIITVVVVHHRCFTWWRHQMETFSVLLGICAGNSPVTGEFPAKRPVTRSFDVVFDLRPIKRLSKQWWFETPLSPLWCHSNVYKRFTKSHGRNSVLDHRHLTICVPVCSG